MKKKILMHYPSDMSDKTIISNIIKNYDLDINFLKAEINPDQEGTLIVEIEGSDENFQKGLDYLEKNNIRIEPASKMIERSEKKCTNCGACVVHCPSKSLYYKNEDKEVAFDPEKCIRCEVCVAICPFNAMKIEF